MACTHRHHMFRPVWLAYVMCRHKCGSWNQNVIMNIQSKLSESWHRLWHYRPLLSSVTGYIYHCRTKLHREQNFYFWQYSFIYLIRVLFSFRGSGGRRGGICILKKLLSTLDIQNDHRHPTFWLVDFCL